MVFTRVTLQKGRESIDALTLSTEKLTSKNKREIKKLRGVKGKRIILHHANINKVP